MQFRQMKIQGESFSTEQWRFPMKKICVLAILYMQAFLSKTCNFFINKSIAW